MTKNWNKIAKLKETGIYAKILSYPGTGISRAEKHCLCEWLMEQRGENIHNHEVEAGLDRLSVEEVRGAGSLPDFKPSSGTRCCGKNHSSSTNETPSNPILTKLHDEAERWYESR